MTGEHAARHHLMLQLDEDLPHHLAGRGWHEFETYHPRVAVLLIYDLLERFELQATIMVSPPDNVTGKHLVYVAKAMDKEDDRGLDFQAARDLLEQCKRLERTDRKMSIAPEGGRPDPGSRSGPRLEVHQVLGGSRPDTDHGSSSTNRLKDVIRATDRPRGDDSRKEGA